MKQDQNLCFMLVFIPEAVENSVTDGGFGEWITREQRNISSLLFVCLFGFLSKNLEVHLMLGENSVHFGLKRWRRCAPVQPGLRKALWFRRGFHVVFEHVNILW